MTASTVLSVRVSPREREVLEAAAEQSRSTLSEFMRRKALEAAEEALLERRVIQIPSETWAEFETWLEQPAEDNQRLRTLLNKQPSWEA